MQNIEEIQKERVLDAMVHVKLFTPYAVICFFFPIVLDVVKFKTNYWFHAELMQQSCI